MNFSGKYNSISSEERTNFSRYTSRFEDDNGEYEELYDAGFNSFATDDLEVNLNEDILSILNLAGKYISTGALDFNKRIWALVAAGELALLPFFIKGCTTFLHYSTEGGKDVPGIATINEKGSGPAAFVVNIVLYLYIGYLTMRFGPDSYLAHKLRNNLDINRSRSKIIAKLVATGIFTSFAAYVFYIMGRYADDDFMNASNFIANFDMNWLGSTTMIMIIISVAKLAWRNLDGWLKYFCRKRHSLSDKDADKKLHKKFIEEFEKEIKRLKDLPNNEFDGSNSQTLLKSIKKILEELKSENGEASSFFASKEGPVRSYTSCKDTTFNIFRYLIYGIAHLGAQFCLGVSNFGLWKLMIKYMPGKTLAVRIPLGTSAFAPFGVLGMNMARETVEDIGEMVEDAAKVIVVKTKTLVCKNESQAFNQNKDSYSLWQKIGVGFIFTIAATFAGVGYGLSWLSSAGGDQINAQGILPLKSTWADYANGVGFLLFNGYGFLQISILFFTFFYLRILFTPQKRNEVVHAKQLLKFVKDTPELFEDNDNSNAGYGPI